MPTGYADKVCRQAVPTGCHRDHIRDNEKIQPPIPSLVRNCQERGMPTTYADNLCRHLCRQPMPTTYADAYADNLCRRPMPTTYADRLCQQAVTETLYGTMKRFSLLYKWSKNALQGVCRQPMPTHLCRQPMPTTYADTLCRHPMPTTYADNLCRQACQSRALH